MEISLKTIAHILGGEVRGSQALVPGPGHSREDRSLSITISNSGDDIIVHSFASDDPIACKQYVREKCGIPFKPNGGERFSEADIERAVMAAAQARTPKSKPTATYDYRGGDGALLYQVLRYDAPKRFRHRQPDGHGGWIYRGTHQRIVYRYPDLLTFPSGTVFVTEGEKDADRLWSIDLCATTVASGRWTDDCVQALAGRHILILEDNDEAGSKKALGAAQLLHGVADTVRIVRLPGLGEGGDVSDWLDADPRRGASELADVCFDAPLWEPSAKGIDSIDSIESTTSAARYARRIESRSNSNSENKEPSRAVAKFPMLSIESIIQLSADCEYLIDDLLPRSGLALIWGAPKTGKSFWVMDAALNIALGRQYRERHVEQGAIIYLGLEGQYGLRKRVLAFIRHHFGDKVPYIPVRLILVPINLVTDAKALIAEIKLELGDERPAAVVIDTLARAMPGRSESKDADMAAFIKAADSICRAFDCLVPIVHHSGWTGDHSRGHSSLPAAVDAELSVRNNDQGDIIVRVERAKDGPSGIEVYSRLLPVDTGKVDKNGKPIISMVVVPVEGANIPAKPKKQIKSKSLDLAVKIITDFATEPAQPFADGPIIKCANTEAVRLEFYKQYVGGTDAKKHAWNRAMNTNKVIGQRDGKCWII